MIMSRAGSAEPSLDASGAGASDGTPARGPSDSTCSRNACAANERKSPSNSSTRFNVGVRMPFTMIWQSPNSHASRRHSL